ncbi:MAG: DUF445 domain-containing protein [Candidatus Binatia bacterium]
MNAIVATLLEWLKTPSTKPSVERPHLSHSPAAAWPDDLPRVKLKDFFFRWSAIIARSLASFRSEAAASAETGRFQEQGRRAVSLKIAAAFNLLYWPFFWSGILLASWFAADVLLRALMSPASYRSLDALSRPVLAIAAPTAVGFWTNWLAIKMLFLPRDPNAVWWGLVPARRTQIVDAIAEGVLTRLISPEIVRDYLHRSGILKNFVERAVPAMRETIDDAEFRRDTKGLVYGLVYDFANSDETRRTVETMVQDKINDWTGETLGRKVVEWTKSLWGPVVLNEVVKALPEIPKAMDHVFDRIDRGLDGVPRWIERESESIERILTTVIVEGLRGLDIKQIVKTQLDKMDEQELERMLTGTVTTELRFIQTSGGVFGLLAGIAFVIPETRLALLLAALGLWVAYRATVKRRLSRT